VEREAVPVTVHALAVTGVRGAEIDLEVRCSPGTYVRALARDLGERLGTGGHLAALRRIRSGGFGLEATVTWDDLDTRALENIVPLSQLLPDLPAVVVGPEGLEAVRHGRVLDRALVRAGFPEAPPPPRVRVVGDAGQLVALAVPRGFDGAVPGLAVEPVLHPDIVLLG
jgi:tRNA pseudouridine55 synthase